MTRGAECRCFSQRDCQWWGRRLEIESQSRWQRLLKHARQYFRYSRSNELCLQWFHLLEFPHHFTNRTAASGFSPRPPMRPIESLQMGLLDGGRKRGVPGCLNHCWYWSLSLKRKKSYGYEDKKKLWTKLWTKLSWRLYTLLGKSSRLRKRAGRKLTTALTVALTSLLRFSMRK